MQYILPLDRILLTDYRQLLRRQNLLPGRRILLEQLDERFSVFAKLGFATVAQLKAALSTPQKLTSLAAKTEIPEEYLVILRRELGSLEQKPVPLIEFPACDSVLIESLATSGIRSSQALWELGSEASAELFSLCDLVRINGVGAIAARMFYEAGYPSVAAVAQANAADLLACVSAVNAEKGYYKAKLGEKDMQFCIDFAKLLEKYS
jgi:hypothetical protein